MMAPTATTAMVTSEGATGGSPPRYHFFKGVLFSGRSRSYYSLQDLRSYYYSSLRSNERLPTRRRLSRNKSSSKADSPLAERLTSIRHHCLADSKSPCHCPSLICSPSLCPCRTRHELSVCGYGLRAGTCKKTGTSCCPNVGEQAKVGRKLRMSRGTLKNDHSGRHGRKCGVPRGTVNKQDS